MLGAFVLLHAGIADSRMWAATVDALSDSYRVITYDQRGFGRSQPAPIVPFRPMDDVVAVLDHLTVDRFSVIGCSMGGTLVIDLAVQHPRRVQALGAQIETLPGVDHNMPERAGSKFTNLLRQFLDATLCSD